MDLFAADGSGSDDEAQVSEVKIDPFAHVAADSDSDSNDEVPAAKVSSLVATPSGASRKHHAGASQLERNSVMGLRGMRGMPAEFLALHPALLLENHLAARNSAARATLLAAARALNPFHACRRFALLIWSGRDHRPARSKGAQRKKERPPEARVREKCS